MKTTENENMKNCIQPIWKAMYKHSIVNTIRITLILAILTNNYSNVYSQSGGWSGSNQWANGASVSDGSGGYFDYGSGVIRLTDDVNSGCTASAIHSAARYSHCDSNFSKCYWVLFGCGDADGMAFTMSYGCGGNPSSDWKVWGCGGGLGYRHGCAWNQGVTIEFDTYNNAGGDGFDGSYAGAGDDDEIAIHRNVEATDGGKMTAVSVPNLEDGMEHRVCIDYNRTSHVITVSIDGVNRITYDLDAGGLNPDSYFSGCELLTTWSAGTNAGLNTQAVSDGPMIINEAGQLCPQMLPVEFIDVHAQPVSSSVIVSWSTAKETNNEKFIIERSSDLSDWTVIGEVKGAINSSTDKNYSFTDFQPLNGNAYYRIRQVDIDGKFAISKVVSVNSGETTVSIAPNPFDETLSITTNLSGKIDVTIRDVVGRTLYQVTKDTENGLFNIQPDLLPGAYILTIQSESFIIQKEIIKK